jgi:hypothetical protein
VRAGDPSSLLRAGAALVLPRPTAPWGEASAETQRWLEPAERWLRMLSTSGVDGAT